MDVVGISPLERDAILDVVAAVLHLGNLNFEGGDEARAVAGKVATSAAANACGLLGIAPAALTQALEVRPSARNV